MQNFRNKSAPDFFMSEAGSASFRINIKQKAHSLAKRCSGKKSVVCMLSVTMAAATLLVFTLSNTEKEPAQISVMESIHAEGDILTASADPNKFTGKLTRKSPGGLTLGSSILASTLFDTGSQQSSKVSEIAQELADSYLVEEDLQITVSKTGAKEQGQLQNEKKSLTVLPTEVNREIEKEIKVIEKEQTVEHPVEQRMTSLLRPGEERVIQAGTDGSKTVVYEQELVDGEILDEKVVSEIMLQEPIQEIKLVGAQGSQAAISPLNFGVELDETGAPVSYSRVLTNQVATGYSAGSGAWGASGQSLSAGYVAVHPGKIPYGTRMYITSPDNSFVYGFAIAADTGAGLLGDVIDVDLYYDTYLESCLNGRRNVNIYILD